MGNNVPELFILLLDVIELIVGENFLILIIIY